jgi:hypothetical protein
MIWTSRLEKLQSKTLLLWELPCDVSFDANEKDSVISYIHNLHPVHHSDLYATLEKIISVLSGIEHFRISL